MKTFENLLSLARVNNLENLEVVASTIYWFVVICFSIHEYFDHEKLLFIA